MTYKPTAASDNFMLDSILVERLYQLQKPLSSFSASVNYFFILIHLQAVTSDTLRVERHFMWNKYLRIIHDILDHDSESLSCSMT